MVADLCCEYLFKLPSGKPGGEKVDSLVEKETKDKTSSKDEEYILCRQCHWVITSPTERIEVQGSHQHTFANPAGIIYQIGCFRSANGCGHVGSAKEEWSWFKGFSWRIAVCGKCLEHLGWRFESSGNESFHGLILNRLLQ
jgi:hypothetical protein